MTTNVEEETKPNVNGEKDALLWLDGSVGRALEYQFKCPVGSNPTPVEVFGLRLLAPAWPLTIKFKSEGALL